MSSVYLAEHELMKRRVAVKVLPDYADFHGRVDFIQEINFMKVRQWLYVCKCTGQSD